MINRVIIIVFVTILFALPLVLNILPAGMLSDKMIQILLLFIIFFFSIFYGVVSIFTGYLGITKGELELFWKKYYTYGKFWEDISKKTGHHFKSEADIAKGNYAKFWGFVYILFGIILLSAGIMLLLVMLSMFKTK